VSGRVLVVLHEETLGGASLAIARVAPALQRRGWEPSFWVGDPSPAAAALRGMGLDVHGAPRLEGSWPRPLVYSLRALRLPPGPLARMRAAPGYLRELRRVLDEVRPTVVHANTLLSLWEARAAHRAGFAVGLHVHEMLPAGPRGWVAGRMARSASDVAVAVSAACARSLERAGLHPRVVHGGTAPSAPAREREPNGAVVVGTVGAISRRKGSDVFVEAARSLLAGEGGLEFRMLGAADAPFEAGWAAPVLERASRLGIAHEVSADVTAAMAGWDIFVLPSRADPFPSAVLEAMAAGLPVVASAVDGIPEQLTPECGVLVEPNDPTALADAIARLAADPELRRRMGETGRRRVAERFTLDRQADGLHAAYRAAISARSG
jgi:glycosyltransferase involved in cell wall biosynthesis